MRHRLPTCQCNCRCPGGRRTQRRPKKKAPRGLRPEPQRTPECTPGTGQDHGQRLRLCSGVASWLSGFPVSRVEGQLLRAPGASRFSPPHPSVRYSDCLQLPCGFFLPKGQCLISQVQVPRTCPVSSPKSFLPSSGSLGKPGALDCSSQSQRWQSQSVRRNNPAYLPLSLSFFLSFLLPLSPLKFPAP